MNLGGDDFDSELIRLMKEKFIAESGIDIDKLETIERKEFFKN